MKVCPTCQRTHADDIAFCPHDGTPLQQTDNALNAGQVIKGRYEIEALIAETLDGRIYRARNIMFDSRVALKMFKPELCCDADGELSDFQVKLRDVSRFRYPNTVDINEITDNYMVM